MAAVRPKAEEGTVPAACVMGPGLRPQAGGELRELFFWGVLHGPVLLGVLGSSSTVTRANASAAAAGGPWR